MGSTCPEPARRKSGGRPQALFAGGDRPEAARSLQCRVASAVRRCRSSRRHRLAPAGLPRSAPVPAHPHLTDLPSICRMTYPFDETTQQQLVEIIRRHAQPLQPLPTGVQPRLKPLNEVRAVLFDIYGTLLISGSGDVGTGAGGARPAAFGEPLAAVGITFRGDNAPGIELLAATIEGHHARDRQQGIEFPEVDIREVWRDVLRQLGTDGLIAAEQVPDDTTLLALEYEVRTNPVAPMPDCLEVLDELRDKGMLLGLVSNAQIFTRLLFPALFERSLHGLGIPPELCAWSYQHRR